MASRLRQILRVACAFVLLIPAATSRAEACGLLLRVTYAEDYPDWFHIEFLEGDGFKLESLRLDLSTAAGRPFIDTAYPDSRHSGRDGVVVTESAGLETGSQAMAFGFAHFTAGKAYRLLVDLDGQWDQLQSAELHGTQVQASFERSDGTSLTLTGRFDAEGVAELGNRACA